MADVGHMNIISFRKKTYQPPQINWLLLSEHVISEEPYSIGRVGNKWLAEIVTDYHQQPVDGY